MAAAYLMRGPAGAALDFACASLVFRGFAVESVNPGTAYRVREATDRAAQVRGATSQAHRVALAALELAALPAGSVAARECETRLAQLRADHETISALLAQAPEAFDLAAGRVAPGVMLAAAAKSTPPGVTLTPEPLTAASRIRSTAPARTAWRRCTTIAGLRGFYAVPRALDLGLIVADMEGEALRYSVTGPTAAQVSLYAAIVQCTRAAALQALSITAEDEAAEDSPEGMPPIRIELPTRRTVSDIAHDAAGRITHVEQTESTVEGD